MGGGIEVGVGKEGSCGVMAGEEWGAAGLCCEDAGEEWLGFTEKRGIVRGVIFYLLSRYLEARCNWLLC